MSYRRSHRRYETIVVQSGAARLPRVPVTRRRPPWTVKDRAGGTRDEPSRPRRVPSVWMHARLAGMIRGAETTDYLKRRVEEGFGGSRPRWGDLQRMEEEAFGDEATRFSEMGVLRGAERSVELERAGEIGKLVRRRYSLFVGGHEEAIWH